jgi:hypothetical protein
MLPSISEGGLPLSIGSFVFRPSAQEPKGEEDAGEQTHEQHKEYYTCGNAVLLVQIVHFVLARRCDVLPADAVEFVLEVVNG